jgi:iron complex transport system substrate-binding protein
MGARSSATRSACAAACNVFADLLGLAPKVSVEAVLAANPEVIVASGMGEERPEWLDDWRRWKQLTAVARDNLYFVPPALIQRHTPRLLEGTEIICQHLDDGAQPSGRAAAWPACRSASSA